MSEEFKKAAWKAKWQFLSVISMLGYRSLMMLAFYIFLDYIYMNWESYDVFVDFVEITLLARLVSLFKDPYK